MISKLYPCKSSLSSDGMTSNFLNSLEKKKKLLILTMYNLESFYVL